MSVTDPKFKHLLNAIEKTLNSSAVKESRLRKEKRIQAFGISADEIYKELIHKFSPFKIPGREVSDADLRPISKIVADDLWRVFKSSAKGKKFTAGQEKDFLNYSGVSFLFNDSLKIIYGKGQSGSDNQEVLRANVAKPAKSALNSRPVGDYTRTFFNPHPEYVAKKEQINAQMRKEFLAVADPKQFDTPKKVNAKLDNIRTRGDTFGEYPKDYWKNQLIDLKLSFGGVNLEGTQLGHGYGGQVSVTTNLAENPENFFQDSTEFGFETVQLIQTIPAKFEPEVRKGILSVQNKDANLEYVRFVRANSAVYGEITVLLPELKDKNQKEGQEAQEAFLKDLRPVLLNIKDVITDAGGSPSYNKLLSDLIENTFLGKKSGNKKYVTKAKIKRKRKKVPIGFVKLKAANLKTAKRRSGGKQSSSKEGPNLQNIIDLLNSKLHDKIQENMGKGKSKKILNYRTGRFARSAKIQKLLPSKEKNAINAVVKYMRKPYGVFEPGNTNLATPGRSPARIFGRSIRQLLQEEKIAKLRRVKVTLRG